MYLLKCNYFLSFDYHIRPSAPSPGSILHVRIQCLANNLRPQHVHIISCVPFARICEAHTELNHSEFPIANHHPPNIFGPWLSNNQPGVRAIYNYTQRTMVASKIYI